jgi:hypothetical protein
VEDNQPEAVNIYNVRELMNEEISVQNKLKKIFGKKIEDIVKKSEKNSEKVDKGNNSSDSLSISEDEQEMINYANENTCFSIISRNYLSWLKMPLFLLIVKRKRKLKEKIGKEVC